MTISPLKIKKINCEQCGRVTEARSTRKRFCGSTCRNAAWHDEQAKRAREAMEAQAFLDRVMDCIGVAEIKDGVLDVGGVKVPMRIPRGHIGVYVRKIPVGSCSTRSSAPTSSAGNSG
jgi:hypothetical protein